MYRDDVNFACLACFPIGRGTYHAWRLGVGGVDRQGKRLCYKCKLSSVTRVYWFSCRNLPDGHFDFCKFHSLPSGQHCETVHNSTITSRLVWKRNTASGLSYVCTKSLHEIAPKISLKLDAQSGCNHNYLQDRDTLSCLLGLSVNKQLNSTTHQQQQKCKFDKISHCTLKLNI
jgi:hypothetical protein